jgi:hypothetical protein
MSDNSSVSPEEAVSTPRQGTATVTNAWGVALAQITLRHRRGNDPSREEQMTFTSLGVNETSAAMPFTYETGAGSPRDYWWITFLTVGGTQWSCKDNFYCSVSSSDTGAVALAVRADTKTMTVSFSRSSGCSVGLSQLVLSPEGSSPEVASPEVASPDA